MLGKTKQILGTNPFVPTSNLFPLLDLDRLTRELKPQSKGRKRGKRDLPSSDSQDLDGVELEIIRTIEDLRHQSINTYHEHKETYLKRLSDVSTAITEIETSTSQPSGGFRTASKEHETRLQDATERLRDCIGWKLKFKNNHNINRPAHHIYSGGIKWVFIGLIMVVFESILNGPLLSQKHELGFLGGGLTALLISIANVVFSSAIGFYSRFVNHRKLLAKLFGLLLIIFWAGMILVFNFGIAHFRDGVVSNLTWDEAARNTIPSLLTPFQLDSIESWLLVLIGCLISFLALLKGYYSDDPYPGYGNLERELNKARSGYTEMHTNTLDNLKEERDWYISNMEEAEKILRSSMSETNDALYGNRSLDVVFKEYLNHFDETVHQILQIYRDSNTEHRSTPPPSYFNSKFPLKPVTIDPPEKEKMRKQQTEIERVAEMVKAASKEISELWNASVSNFPSAKDIEDEIKLAFNDSNR